ncbi:MAG: hypothetical protein ACREQY_09815, partial [Candidatus Binatia bacterium]
MEESIRILPPQGRRRQNAFRRQGDYWIISYRGHTVRLRDAKGLRYLARLIRHPGRELHVMELAAEADGSALE